MAITDPALPTPERWVQAALDVVAAGVDLLQLRARTLDRATLDPIARRLLHATHTSPTRLLINTDLDLAVTVRAHGVHLPSNAPLPPDARARLEDALGHPALLSRACHTLDDLARANDEGADLCTWSPVFAPRSKRADFPLQGLDGLAAAARTSRSPLLALGGLDVQRAPACIGAGAAGVAVIGAIFGAARPADAARALMRVVHRP